MDSKSLTGPLPARLRRAEAGGENLVVESEELAIGAGVALPAAELVGSTRLGRHNNYPRVFGQLDGRIKWTY
jgi:hypothetical protein